MWVSTLGWAHRRSPGQAAQLTRIVHAVAATGLLVYKVSIHLSLVAIACNEQAQRRQLVSAYCMRRCARGSHRHSLLCMFPCSCT